jgi:hypothetical protein
LIWLSTFLACEAPTAPPAGDAAPTPFEACDPVELDRLAKKHAFTPVFDVCSSNQYSSYSWSTDGHRLHFMRGLTHYVMDAASKDKKFETVPTLTPIGSVAWVSENRVVFPVGPPTDGPRDAPPRMSVYAADSKALFALNLDGLVEPNDLQRGATPGEVLFTARRAGEGTPRQVFRIDLQSGFVTEPFPWLDAVDTFSWSAAARGVVVGVGNTVTLYDPDGKKLGLWSPATRGSLHPGGRWLVLEHLGEPTNVFQPTDIDELPPAERAAALARAEERAARLPEGIERTVRPPMLSFVDTTTAKRFLITAVQGSRFQWWEKQDFYGSFLSWGFEQKQFRRNVLLGNLGSWLRAAEEGRTMLGFRPLTAESVTTGEAAPVPAR